jgi:tetratricopeptide (TPR) repeat protein
LLAGGLVVALVAALAAGVPHRLSHGWHDFKYSNGSNLSGNNLGNDLGTRLTTLSGEGRYQYWRTALDATSGRRLQGSGPATFQYLWLPRASKAGGYVTNAHSLYVETLAESGLVGLLLLIGFMGVIVGAAILAVIRSRDGDRTAAAAATGALLAFIVAASVDWVWQLPVVPVAFLLVAAAVLAPAPATRPVRAIDEDQPRTDPPSRRAPLALRLGLVLAAIACLAGIAVPLGTASNVQQSQRAINAGNTVAALADARTATRIEPGAASPHVQQALVLELQRNFGAAVAQARQATQAEPQNWSPWLILSRLEAEAGHPKASVAAFKRARSLNPLSPIFRQ